MEENVATEDCAIMIHQTRACGLWIAAAMHHDIDAPTTPTAGPANPADASPCHAEPVPGRATDFKPDRDLRDRERPDPTYPHGSAAVVVVMTAA
jgi:hypothetical protein